MESIDNSQTWAFISLTFGEENHKPLQFLLILVYICYLLVRFELLQIFF